MKSTAALFQICAVYVVLLECSSPALTAPNVTGKEDDELSLNWTKINVAQNTTVKPYAAYYNIITVDEKIGENILTSDTPPSVIDNMIYDDEQPTNNHSSLNRSKQKDYSKYDQHFKTLFEYLASASRKYKAKMTTEQSFGKDLTTNTFNDLVATEMPQTKRPNTANTTSERLNSSPESAFTPLVVTWYANSTTTQTSTTFQQHTTSTWSPTTLCPTTTSTTTPTSETTTSTWPTIPYPTTTSTTTPAPMTTTSTWPPTTPYYPTTKRPKPNKFSCTLCVIVVYNE